MNKLLKTLFVCLLILTLFLCISNSYATEEDEDSSDETTSSNEVVEETPTTGLSTLSTRKCYKYFIIK